ncbi:MAG: hypothetical protein JRI23_04110 [Deltaproteobacteria bacterium]|jgi:predicted nucleic-acid-binding Zn-ribbon protein|nr:hypothetical protein [Deltaproteobacteria bacterium]MBW2530711.1 hypothetical protein [Deltaproteobacteria bacterium]
MKNSLACPKCQSRKLWRVERVASCDRPGSVPCQLRVVVRRDRPTDGFFDTAQTMGYFDAYICAECGYSELFAHYFDELIANPEAGVHFIDTTPQQGEYR